jgi:hypothetical protein
LSDDLITHVASEWRAGFQPACSADTNTCPTDF